MSQVVATLPSPPTPVLITPAGERAGERFLEFFASAIRNPHTRGAYARAAGDFLAWCAGAGVPSITAVQPLHVAVWIELQTQTLSAPIGLRDRALIALMAFLFARIGAAPAMRVDDVYVLNRRLWVRLRERGGKAHAMPCHHTLEAYLHDYLEQTGLRDGPKGSLFCTVAHDTGQLSTTPLPQANAYAMVGRRALAAGIGTRIGNGTFRATGIMDELWPYLDKIDAPEEQVRKLDRKIRKAQSG